MLKGLRSKERREKRSSLSTSSTEAKPDHNFTKNFEIQTLSLKEALKNQLQMTKAKREELRDLNNRFDIEVSNRRKAEDEVVNLQNKLQILQNKVKGLELQYDIELNKELYEAAASGSTSHPNMMTIRKIHQFSQTTEKPNLDQGTIGRKQSFPNNNPKTLERGPVSLLATPPQKKLGRPPPKFKGPIKSRANTIGPTTTTTASNAPTPPPRTGKIPFGLSIPMRRPTDN